MRGLVKAQYIGHETRNHLHNEVFPAEKKSCLDDAHERYSGNVSDSYILWAELLPRLR